MNASFRSYLAVFAAVFAALSCGRSEDEGPDKRLLAGWKIVQADGLGDVYYFYPDGLFVRQGVRRREFVTIGRWKVEEKTRLVLFDFDVRNTTLNGEALAEIKAKKHPYDLSFADGETMHWSSLSESDRSQMLQRIRELPDRTENVYWGLGTEEDYDRAARRERGLPLKQKKKPNQSPQRNAGAWPAISDEASAIHPASSVEKMAPYATPAWLISNVRQ